MLIIDTSGEASFSNLAEKYVAKSRMLQVIATKKSGSNDVPVKKSKVEKWRPDQTTLETNIWPF